MSKGIRAGELAVVSVVALLVVLALAVSACGGSSAGKVTAGDTVSVKYKLTLDSGEIIDTSMDARPLKFVVGMGQMIKGFDAAVVGMKLNEEKSFVVPPAEGYGERDSSLIRNYPRSLLPADVMPEVGMNLMGPHGKVPILAVTEDSVLLDTNPQLAGQNLNFQVTLIGLAKGVAPAAEATEAPKPK